MQSFIDQQKAKQFSKLEFLAKQVVEGFITGMHKSPFHGFSVEFAEHRLYNTGESTRHIDWKLFAKTEKLFVKRYEEETNLRCQLVIDCSSSMFYPDKKQTNLNKLEFSINAAACLIELFKKQRDGFGVSLFDEVLNVHTTSKNNPAHHKMVYAELNNLLQIAETDKKGRKSNIANILHEVADRLSSRSLVIIFSDFMENESETEKLVQALQHLKHNKHEVILFHVNDKHTEFDFLLDNRPHRFVDLESRIEIKLSPNAIRDVYIEKVEKFKQDLKLKAGQYKIDFVEADIREGFEKVLLSYMAKRNRMI